MHTGANAIGRPDGARKVRCAAAGGDNSVMIRYAEDLREAGMREELHAWCSIHLLRRWSRGMARWRGAACNIARKMQSWIGLRPSQFQRSDASERG